MLQRFVIRRIIIAVFQLIGISLAVFFLIRMLPADPVARIVGMNATPDIIAQAKASLGLDKTVLQQLGNYIGIFSDTKDPGILEGSLGVSWVTGESISEEVGRFLPVTLELITYSLIIALLIAIPTGVVSATRPGGIGDKIVFVWGLFAGSQPEFWWALIFVFFFFFWSFELFGISIAPAPLGRLGPLTDAPDVITGFIVFDALIQGEFEAFVDAAWHLMLPVGTLVFVVSGPIIKMVRQNMVRVLRSDYVLYARSCGLPSRTIALYALRAAMAPAMTLIGIFYGFLLGGAVPVELIYSLGGLGEYSLRSILYFDYPAIQGTVLTIAMVSLIIYLVIDILHAFIDPRVTY
jgi:ABC-type dipeptide/oligopeptide/nickel transport system permease component